jgi:hypothetical protein
LLQILFQTLLQKLLQALLQKSKFAEASGCTQEDRTFASHIATYLVAEMLQKKEIGKKRGVTDKDS